MSLALGAFPVARIVKASLWERTPLTTPPERAYEWIRRNTPESAIFAVELDGRFYLHTRRRTAHFRRIERAEPFRRWLQTNRVGFVALFPNDFVMRTVSGDTPHDPSPIPMLLSLLADDALYEPVFRDDEEGSRVYRVRPLGLAPK